VKRAALSERFAFAQKPFDTTDGVVTACQQATARQRSDFQMRIADWFGDSVAAALAAPFDRAAHGARASNSFEPLRREEFIDWVSREPRVVSAPGLGGLAEIELRDSDGKLRGGEYGVQLEPGADVYLLSANGLISALAGGVAVGARHLDRSHPRLGELCEALVAVAGVDTFTKLFVSSGDESVTGWHRDPQDVFVTMAWGAKRFQVAKPEYGGETPGESDLELDAYLQTGDCLLLPQGRLHRAIPDGAESGLMSIAMLRRHNWIERDELPSHLGVDEHPPSDDVYRLLLRPRYLDAAARYESVRVASPGGIDVVGRAGDEVLIVLGGALFSATEDEVMSIIPMLSDEAEGWASAQVLDVLRHYGLLRRATRG
jgi:hypothetical protein